MSTKNERRPRSRILLTCLCIPIAILFTILPGATPTTQADMVWATLTPTPATPSVLSESVTGPLTTTIALPAATQPLTQPAVSAPVVSQPSEEIELTTPITPVLDAQPTAEIVETTPTTETVQPEPESSQPTTETDEPTSQPENVADILIPAEPTPAPQPEPQLQPAPSPAELDEIVQMRAFWASAYNEGYRTPGEVDELIANVVRANANTLIVQMRRHGDSWYTRSIEPRAADPDLAPAETFDALDNIIAKAHAHGIKVHAWLVVSVACRDHDDLRGHPDHVCTSHGPYIEGTESWTTVTYDHEPVGDLDFGHPSAVHHMEAVVTNIVQNYPDLDGLHFDFIRYSDVTYGYNSVSVDRFNRAHNLPQDNWPDPYDPDWSQWRRDRLTELMRRIYIRSKAINSRIEISIAAITWGGPGDYSLDNFRQSAAYTRVFQDWQSWLQEGIIDFAVPMHYFEESRANNRSWLDGWLAWDRANVGRRAIVPGLGSWLNTPDENVAQVMRSIAPDAEGRFLSGVAFYAYHNLFVGSDTQRRQEFLDMLRSGVFAQPARAPDWPWMTYPTTGHLQGIAVIDGETIPDAVVSLVKDGTWVRDITASVDGWYGAVELEPGDYTIVVRSPTDDRQASYEHVIVHPGVVAHGS